MSVTGHMLQVMRLYRRALKTSLDWTIDRQAWRREAMIIRHRFEERRRLTDAAAIRLAISEAEAELEKHKHPDPYICAFRLSVCVCISRGRNGRLCLHSWCSLSNSHVCNGHCSRHVFADPSAPGGSKYERNVPPPPWVCVC